jgi:hypothetical protein
MMKTHSGCFAIELLFGMTVVQRQARRCIRCRLERYSSPSFSRSTRI